MRHLAILAALACLPTTAAAQDSIFDIPESEQLTFADVGIAGVSRETYVGSSTGETLVLPYLNTQYKGRFFVNPGLGAGAYAIRNEHFRLGGSVHFSLGRDGADTPLNNEAFDLDGGFAGLISSRLYLPLAAVDVVANIPLTGDLEGYRVDALVTTELYPFEKLRLTPGVRATYHSGDFLNSVYGITDSQLANVSLPVGSNVTAQNFGAEVSTLGAHVAAYYELSDDYEIVGIVNFSRLIGDVEGTTLAPENSGITAALGFARKF